MKARRVGVAAALGALALLLSGCAANVPGAVVTTSPASPSPTPTPVVTAQPVRVPVTCDDLVPTAEVAKISAGLSAEAASHSASLTSWNDDRVGALRCAWSNGADGDDQLRVTVTVAPEVAREGFEAYLNGEQGGGTAVPSVGADAYIQRVQDRPFGFVFLTSHYGARAYLEAGPNVQLASDADTTLLTQVHGVVAGLDAPGPLWKPSPDLKGASSCEGLASLEQVEASTGLPSPDVVKSDSGEYSASSFDIDRQVGGFSCFWGSANGAGFVSAAVLPGGASYAPNSRVTGSVDVAGVGESAFLTPDGMLNVVADHGWVQVKGDGNITRDQLTALAKQVLVKVGFGG